MIIIDKDKLDLLCRQIIVQRVDSKYVDDKEQLKLLVDHLIRDVQRKVRHECKLLIHEDQITLLHREYIHSYYTYELHLGFNPDSKIALWDDIDKIIEVPTNFKPPFSVHVEREVPKKINWGGVETELPYDVVQYFPWGYDLERNVQIWKKEQNEIH